MNEHYERWNRLAPIGLLLTGLGLSITGRATLAKGKGTGWVLGGTLGLIVFNAGLAIFGEAVKARALYEMHLEQFRQPAD